ncbi:MAG TPA: heavy metal translocating P-type ATPase [Ilumatobacteraceae bacterium]|nr:heavy metal translocating P-type ATPase [Ilumatobacteraceae bacterium]
MSGAQRAVLRSAHLELGLLVAASVGLVVGSIAWWSGAEAAARTIWFATTLLGIIPAVGSVISVARQRRLGADVIALAALVGALVVGEVLAGAIITLMLASGRAIEARAAARAQRDLGALVGRAPRTVQRLDGTDLSEVPADVVSPGDLLLVRPGEVLAVDGRVEGGAAVLDESALTGESRQVERVAGDEVRSGVVNAGGPFQMRATSAAADSTYAAIVRLVEQSEVSSAPFVRMADRYSAVFIVFGGLVAGLAWALSGDPVRAVAVLVVATPCPLILAAPIAVVAGLSRAARFGVIVKGGSVLEQLAKGEVLLFDKTGTLTSGQPTVVAVHATNTCDEREVLRLAASLDQVSPHVLATAVVRAALVRELELSLPSGVEEIAGHGIRGVVDGATVWVGKLSWLGEELDQEWGRSIRRRADRDGRLVVFVRAGADVIGAVTLEDPIRPDAARTLRRLRADGVRRMVMVTGDRDDVARSVAAVVGVDEVLSERSPTEKVDAVRVERNNGSTIMVGDGLNDAAAMAMADVGVALGARGSSAASEAADVVVVVDRIDRLGDAMRVARRSQRIAHQSVIAGMGLSMAAMLVAAVGLLQPTQGALLQELIDVAVIMNALRALRPGKSGPVEIPDADLELVRRFRTEHASLRPDVDRLVAVADQIGVVAPEQALELARDVRRFLVVELLPHEQAEDTELYPALQRVLGGNDATGTMSRGHAEIAHLTHRLGRILDDIDSDRLEGEDATDVLRLLYGLHAVLTLHFSQEDESYLSLADT